MPTPRHNQSDLIFHQVIQELKGMSGSIGSFRSDLETLKKNIEPLFKIVHGDGNVQSINTQIELIKQLQSHHIKELEEMGEELTAMGNRIEKRELEDRKGRWAVIVAIVTGTIGMTGSIIAAIIAAIKN